MKLVMLLCCILSGYVLEYSDTHGRPHKGRHAARSLADAMGWAKCYGPSYAVTVRRYGRILAYRPGAARYTLEAT